LVASGSTYSLSGYINLLLRRSYRTILVEGRSDFELLSRLKAERPESSHVKRVNIDQVELVRDDAVKGLGNKKRIEKIREIIESMPHDFSRFGSLLDREWDGLIDQGNIIYQTWSPPSQKVGSYVTLGHSIENYQFDIDCVVGYVKFAVPAAYSAQLELALRENFPCIISLALAYSIVMASQSMIDRSNNLIEHAHIQFVDGCKLNDDAAAKLSQRGVDISLSRQLFDKINKLANDGSLSMAVTSKFGQWLVHGHLGCNVIWAAVAGLAGRHGASADEINVLARPNCQNRDNYWRDWLSKQPREKKSPLEEALDWALDAS
jgi:hypothetical protein